MCIFAFAPGTLRLKRIITRTERATSTASATGKFCSLHSFQPLEREIAGFGVKLAVKLPRKGEAGEGR
jgi:hypothetical protein